MAITERGKITFGVIDEKGKRLFNGLTEQGQKVFNITGVPVDPTSPPVVTIVSVDRVKISNQSGIDRTIVAFKFDTNVTSWSVNVMGVDQVTGTIADSGGAVTAGTQINATIDYSELYQEGYNKVNIYGQNAIGWTPSETDPNAPQQSSSIVTDGLIAYYHADEGWTSSVWSNISPNNIGSYNGTVVGSLTRDATKGIYFDGATTFAVPMSNAVNYVKLPVLSASNTYEFEMYFQAPFDGTGSTELFGGTMSSDGIKATILGTMDDGSSSGGGNKTTDAFSPNTVYKINYCYNHVTMNEKYYINDVLKFDATYTSPFESIAVSPWTIGSVYYTSMYGYVFPFKGHIKSFKIYNRELTGAERTKNTTNGTTVGI